jgi:hypothetical protein
VRSPRALLRPTLRVLTGHQLAGPDHRYALNAKQTHGPPWMNQTGRMPICPTGKMPVLLVERCATRLIPGDKLGAQVSESSSLDRAARALHEIEVEMEVVNGDQAQPQDLLSLD